MRQNITLQTLASRLEVSAATVSKALSGKGRLSEAMRSKVIALAQELGYVPDIGARSLRTRCQEVVGVVILSGINNSWYGTLITSLERILSAMGKTMMLALSDSEAKLQMILSNFSGYHVSGIIAGPVPDCAHALQYSGVQSRGIPVVGFGNLEAIPMNCVMLNQEMGGRLATEHLIALGHRHIAFVAPRGICAERGGSRYHGYRQTMREHGLEPQCLESPVVGYWRRVAYELACQNLIGKNVNQRPTALVCHNDEWALGILLACQQHGLQVPHDLSIVGFDDIEDAAFSSPSLTTIGGIKEVMPELLCDMLQSQDTPVHPPFIQHVVTPKLIVRGTSIPPEK